MKQTFQGGSDSHKKGRGIAENNQKEVMTGGIKQVTVVVHRPGDGARYARHVRNSVQTRCALYLRLRKDR